LVRPLPLRGSPSAPPLLSTIPHPRLPSRACAPSPRHGARKGPLPLRGALFVSVPPAVVHSCKIHTSWLIRLTTRLRSPHTSHCFPSRPPFPPPQGDFNGGTGRRLPRWRCLRSAAKERPKNGLDFMRVCCMYLYL
jgi:hypothetical protein